MQLNVEIKGTGIGGEVVRLLRNERVIDQVLISSFWPAALAEVAAIAPDLPRAYLMGIPTFIEWIARAQVLAKAKKNLPRAYAYLMGIPTLRPDVRLRESWPFLDLKKAGVVAWHPAYQIPLLDHILPLVRRAGYRVNVWTVNDPEEMRRFVMLGADGIITDVPDVLRRILNENLT